MRKSFKNWEFENLCQYWKGHNCRKQKKSWLYSSSWKLKLCPTLSKGQYVEKQVCKCWNFSVFYQKGWDLKHCFVQWTNILGALHYVWWESLCLRNDVGASVSSNLGQRKTEWLLWYRGIMWFSSWQHRGNIVAMIWLLCYH